MPRGPQRVATRVVVEAMDLTLQCGLSPAATQRLPARSGQNQRHRRHGLTIVSGRHTACSPSAQPSRLGLELSSCRRPSRSICLSRARRSGRARAGAAVQATAQGLAAPSPELAAGAVLVLAASLAVRKLILMKQKRPRVVIIGGSFAGLQAASDLRAHAEVYLIDPRSYFEARSRAFGHPAHISAPHSRLPPDLKYNR